MKQEIFAALDSVQQQYSVRILLAVESGSRAWGFASRDSDYDVRFVYAHPADWYLRVFEQRDVIEPQGDALLDPSGWELRKAKSSAQRVAELPHRLPGDRRIPKSIAVSHSCLF